ncbi:hypothetical protein BF29_2340 [Heyndrickxia coagulans DSM 1 = ATCC 7050]|jgi:hypothetical protein|uniref:Uncharacterized protein n=2 Tax=Heyndrickxia coagulans TaxID=1398 RepID=A0AAN0TAA9_HEYCO|nr:hypothetical protein BF29_2340 [Heyndrickxia coagulans DSM 1 = ATCC 7050]AJO24954.1 hypothetical protein SB48_HM08orf06568 [Heyndrickxia coagulans]SHE86299.1 hypothetical protein SAMN02745208_00998 [Heyndrickxia coagulans DSM 1 = ATCC 7050]
MANVGRQNLSYLKRAENKERRLSFSIILAGIFNDWRKKDEWRKYK